MASKLCCLLLKNWNTIIRVHGLSPPLPFCSCVPPQVQFCGVAFRSEGRPVCLHEKVVVQLSPPDQEPFHRSDVCLPDFPSVAASSPKATGPTSCWVVARSKPPLLLCGISSNGLHVAQQEDSEIALCFLFSMAWLESANREQEQQKGRRERCLLSGQGDVFRVPWEDLVYPQFISLPHADNDGDVLIDTSVVPCRESGSFCNDVKPLTVSKKSDQSPRSSEEENAEGECVELNELPLPSFSPQKGSLTQSLSLQVKVRTGTHAQRNTAAIKDTPQPNNVHIGDARRSSSPSTINSQTSASPPARSEEQGGGSCREKSRMFAKETEGKDSGCNEQQKDHTIEEQEKVEGRDTAGGRKESDGEEMDEDGLGEEVEVEEEVHVIIQQNREGLQEEEPMKEDEKKAGTRDVDSCAGTCSDGSYCEKDTELCEMNTEQTESVDSEKEKPVLSPPSPGAEEGFESRQKEEKKEGVDVKGATEINSEGISSFPLSFSMNEASRLSPSHRPPHLPAYHSCRSPCSSQGNRTRGCQVYPDPANQSIHCAAEVGGSVPTR